MLVAVIHEWLWVTRSTSDELKVLKDTLRRKKLQDRVPYMLLGLAIAWCLLFGVVNAVLYGAPGVSLLMTTVMLAPAFLAALAAIVFLVVYDSHAPQKRLLAEDRAFNLNSGLGWTFMNRVLFVGDRHLDFQRQLTVFHKVDASLVDAFWLSELNRELLRRYENAEYAKTKELLQIALEHRARAILDNIKPLIEPLRAQQQVEDDEVRLRRDNAEHAEALGARRMLLEEGLLPNG